VLAAAKRFQRRPVELRAALIGATVGVLAWFALGVVGGDPITQRTLDGTEALLTVLVVFLLRFVLGPASYAAGTREREQAEHRQTKGRLSSVGYIRRLTDYSWTGPSRGHGPSSVAVFTLTRVGRAAQGRPHITGAFQRMCRAHLQSSRRRFIFPGGESSLPW